MSAVACFAEPNLGRKIPENLGHPIAKKCTTRGGFFFSRDFDSYLLRDAVDPRWFTQIASVFNML
jgi:hypothetical protein